LYLLIKEQSKDVAAELGVIGIAAQDVGGLIEVGLPAVAKKKIANGWFLDCSKRRYALRGGSQRQSSETISWKSPWIASGSSTGPSDSTPRKHGLSPTFTSLIAIDPRRCACVPGSDSNVRVIVPFVANKLPD
jgi:hypothetical protein